MTAHTDLAALDGWTPDLPGWADPTTWTSNIPTGWAAVGGIALVGTLAALPLLRRQAFRAGQATTGTANSDTRRDRALLAAALTPAVGFWAAVLLGSARGLIGFGRDTLHWTGGWEYLVPFTLDGVAISFGVLAFRALRKHLNPDRAMRIVWAATGASAAINFFHETGTANGQVLGAAYLALLSLLAMLIFHEFLAQFEDGTDAIHRDNPKFGLRWFTWPTNTACAWVAWRNYPPADGTRATIPVAVEHLETVRRLKQTRRAEQFTDTAWWGRLLPWLRITQLNAKLAEQTLTAQTVNAEIADLREQVSALTAARDAEADRLRAALTEQAERLTAEHAEQLAQVRAQAAAVNLNDYRKTHSGGKRRTAEKASPSAPNRAVMSDEDAVQAMLSAHRDPRHEWTQPKVREITGAGFGRIPKLIEAWRREALRRDGSGRGDDGDADAKERSA